MTFIASPQITVLVQCFDRNGVMRFPVDGSPYFGLTSTLNQSLAPSKQAKEIIATLLGDKIEMEEIKVIAFIEPSIKVEGLQSSNLYLLGISSKAFSAPEEWPTIIPFLRSLKSGDMRNAYYKAIQYFAGVDKNEVDVLEIDHEVKARLLKSLETKDQEIN